MLLEKFNPATCTVDSLYSHLLKFITPTPFSLYPTSSLFLCLLEFSHQHSSILPFFEDLLLTLLTLLATALFLFFSSQLNSLKECPYTLCPILLLPFSLEHILAKLLHWPLSWNGWRSAMTYPQSSSHCHPIDHSFLIKTLSSLCFRIFSLWVFILLYWSLLFGLLY